MRYNSAICQPYSLLASKEQHVNELQTVRFSTSALIFYDKEILSQYEIEFFLLLAQPAVSSS